MRRWLTSLPAKAVEFVLAAIVAIAIADHYYDRVHVSTRTWVFGLLIVGAVALVATVTAIALRQSSPVVTVDPELDEQHRAYAEHVRQILDHLRQVIAGEMPDLNYTDFIERGILEPARDMLRQDPDEDIRLSILAPDDAPNDGYFVMPMAVGHSLPGRQNFRLKIADSISRFAYEKREPFVWNDLSNENAYTPHPKASRPYRSMISLPVCGTDEIYGVFNVISTLDHAFDDADTEYVKTLGSIINVAAGLILADHRGSAGGGAH
jgi:hypothetical protein